MPNLVVTWWLNGLVVNEAQKSEMLQILAKKSRVNLVVVCLKVPQGVS